MKRLSEIIADKIFAFFDGLKNHPVTKKVEPEAPKFSDVESFSVNRKTMGGRKRSSYYESPFP